MFTRNILDILQEDFSPERLGSGVPPILLAKRHWQKMRKTTEFTIAPRKLQGPRKRVRRFTFGGITAEWNNDKLLEARAPLLMIVLNGITDYCCGDYMIQIPAGNAILVPAHVPRRAGAIALNDISDNPHRRSDNILFSEHCGSLQIWLNHDRGNSHYRSKSNEIVMINSTRIIRILEEMDKESVAERAHHQIIVQHLFKVFLLSLQRALQEGKVLLPGRISLLQEPYEDAHNPIREAQDYIREHLNEKLTQDKLARLVRRSRTQFIREFREETGQTFNQFVTQCRIEHAKVLLQDTELTLEFVRMAVGLSSVGYFNRLFRKEVGMLPNEFRRKNIETEKNKS